jgi:chitodextrinase
MPTATHRSSRPARCCTPAHHACTDRSRAGFSFDRRRSAPYGRTILRSAARVACALALAVPATLACCSGATAATGAWQPVGELGQARAEHTATALANGMVLVAGGSGPTSPQARMASAELYSPATGAWAPTGSLATPRSGHAATLLDGPACAAASPPPWCGRVLVTGGLVTLAGTRTATAEVYDPLSGTWAPAASMADARVDHTAIALSDGRVLVAGGVAQVCEEERDPDCVAVPTRTAEIYDPATGTWAPAPDMATPRAQHAAVLRPDGGVLVVGGRSESCIVDPEAPPGRTKRCEGTQTQETERFAPGAGWSRSADLIVSRARHALAPLPEGGLLASGGVATDPRNTAQRRSAERYDPGAGTWAPAAPMAVGRATHVAAALPGGHVVVAGGGSSELIAVDSTEVYDPDSDTWRFAGGLRPGRYSPAAAVAGPGGRLLVAGGVRPQFQRLRAAAVFDPDAPTFPAPVDGLSAQAAASAVTLEFPAVGEVDGFPPVARRYVVRHAQAPVTDEAGFAAARALCGGTCTFEPGVPGDRITLEVNDLPSGTHHFSVRAQDSEGRLGPLSAGASATVAVAPPSAPPAPAPPPAAAPREEPAVATGTVRDLRARATSARTVVLGFSAPERGGLAGFGATRYAVAQSSTAIRDVASFVRSRALCGGVCELAAGAAGDRVTLQVTGLRPSTRYHYAVRAIGPAGHGPVSNPAAVTTRADRIAPGAVPGLSARARSRTSVRLSFRAPASDRTAGPPASRFVIRQARRPITSAARWKRARPLCRGGTCRFGVRRVGQRLSLTVTGLRPGARYHYAVQAVDEAGNRGRRSRSVVVRTRR